MSLDAIVFFFTDFLFNALIITVRCVITDLDAYGCRILVALRSESLHFCGYCAFLNEV